MNSVFSLGDRSLIYDSVQIVVGPGKCLAGRIRYGNLKCHICYELTGFIVDESDLKIGFNRAARIMDMLADYSVVGPEQGTKPREILMTEEMFEAFLASQEKSE